MNPALIEKVGHLFNGLGVVNDVQRAGVHLQPPLIFTSDGVALIDHLKDRSSRGLHTGSYEQQHETRHNELHDPDMLGLFCFNLGKNI